MTHLALDPSQRLSLLRSSPNTAAALDKVLQPKASKTAPASSGREDAGIFFIGNATTVIEWKGARIMTDPNFLHAGDHVHLGPGVTAKRLKDPALDLDELPRLDAILLSHYHEDHFDKLVEDRLNRDFPIITTSHARENLSSPRRKDEPFRNVHALDTFEAMTLDIAEVSKSAEDARSPRQPRVKVTAMPGKHVPDGVLGAANELLGAVPPTNGWMLELGQQSLRPLGQNENLHVGYRIYISGDTLFVDDLLKIPEWLEERRVDLMLLHLGGTSIPGPTLPLLMVTMDGAQGLKLMRLVDPDVAIPVHFDDYDVMKSPLSDFTKAVEESGLGDRVVYLERGEQFQFTVRAVGDV